MLDHSIHLGSRENMLQTVWTDDIATDDDDDDEFNRRNDTLEDEWVSGKLSSLTNENN